MRAYSMVLPSFWTGRTGRQLVELAKKEKLAGRNAQVLASYLMTTGHSNALGIFYLPLNYVEHDTGMTIPEIRAALIVLRQLEFAFYDDETEYIWTQEYTRYQIGRLHPNDGKVRSINRLFHSLPDNPWVGPYFRRYHHDLHLSPRPRQSKITPEGHNPNQQCGDSGDNFEPGSSFPPKSEGLSTLSSPGEGGGGGDPGGDPPRGGRMDRMDRDGSLSSLSGGGAGGGDHPVHNSEDQRPAKKAKKGKPTQTTLDPEAATPEWVVEEWNKLPGIHRYTRPLEGELAKKLKTRTEEYPEKTWWLNYFEEIKASDYLSGRTDTGWVTPLMWAIGPVNIGKVKGGYYPNRTPKVGSYSKPGNGAGHSEPTCNYEPGCSLPSHSTIGSERKCLWHQFVDRHPEVTATWDTFSMFWPKQHPSLRRNLSAAQAWERTGAAARVAVGDA